MSCPIFCLFWLSGLHLGLFLSNMRQVQPETLPKNRNCSRNKNETMFGSRYENCPEFGVLGGVIFKVWQLYCWRFWSAIVVHIHTSTINAPELRERINSVYWSKTVVMLHVLWMPTGYTYFQTGKAHVPHVFVFCFYILWPDFAWLRCFNIGLDK
jgi:hypothetical protein